MQTEQMQTTMQNDTASGLTARKAIGEEQARKAMDTLQKYRQGKSALEARVIASEDWWRMRSWQRIQKGNPEDDKWTSAWLFNVIMGKHADAIAAYPGAGHPPAGTGRPGGGSRCSRRSCRCILEQNDFEEVYSDTPAGQKMKQGTGVWGVYWDSGEAGRPRGYLGAAGEYAESVLLGAGRDGYPEVAERVSIWSWRTTRLLAGGVPAAGGKARRQQRVLARYRTDDVGRLFGKDAGGGLVLQEARGRTGQVLHYCKYVGETVLYATENDTFVPSVTREAR